MKNAASFFALVATASFLLFGNNLAAQKKATWKGGTPGRPNEWNCASNWLENRVPNEFSDVELPNTSTVMSFSPIISAGDFEVNSLSVASEARLYINPSASLTVFETATGVDAASFKGRLILPDSPKTNSVLPLAGNFPHEAKFYTSRRLVLCMPIFVIN